MVGQTKLKHLTSYKESGTAPFLDVSTISGMLHLLSQSAGGSLSSQGESLELKLGLWSRYFLYPFLLCFENSNKSPIISEISNTYSEDGRAIADQLFHHPD